MVGTAFSSSAHWSSFAEIVPPRHRQENRIPSGEIFIRLSRFPCRRVWRAADLPTDGDSAINVSKSGSAPKPAARLSFTDMTGHRSEAPSRSSFNTNSNSVRASLRSAFRTFIVAAFLPTIFLTNREFPASIDFAISEAPAVKTAPAPGRTR